MTEAIVSKNDLNLKRSYPDDEPISDVDWEKFKKEAKEFGVELSEVLTTTFKRRFEILAKNDAAGKTFDTRDNYYIQFILAKIQGALRDKQKNNSLEQIGAIREMLSEQKEHWASFIDEQGYPELPLYYEIHSSSNGCGSAYFVIDERGIPRYVLKVVDEDIFCINNRKGLAGFELGEMVREGIPLYRSAQTDALSSEVARLIGSGSITPRTWMGIYSSREFFDLTDEIPPEKYDDFVKNTGEPSKEKLCSIQEFIHGARDLGEVYFDYQAEGRPFILDQQDFEDVHLLLWTTFDTDAHMFNLMVYQKGIDKEGNIIWGIKKVDNGLCFPEKNVGFRNGLDYFEGAKCPISDALREKIKNMPVDEIIDRIKKYEMDAVIPAFERRITLLQQNIDQLITIADVNRLFRSIEQGEESDVIMENCGSTMYTDFEPATGGRDEIY
jgi:hypothetical protein